MKVPAGLSYIRVAPKDKAVLKVNCVVGGKNLCSFPAVSRSPPTVIDLLSVGQGVPGCDRGPDYKRADCKDCTSRLESTSPAAHRQVLLREESAFPQDLIGNRNAPWPLSTIFLALTFNAATTCVSLYESTIAFAMSLIRNARQWRTLPKGNRGIRALADCTSLNSGGIKWGISPRSIQIGAKMPQASIDKLIVTNLAAFTEKYGAAGANKITAAVDKLITADLARGLKSKLVDLSSATTMSAIGTSVLSAADASDPKRNKKAIDAAFNSYDPRPSYLMLLGSCDVIPHVPLDNQMADDDADVPSDLPYASDNPYSTDPQDFIAPTRVVGRLPNVTADTDPQYLVGLLTTAAKYTARPATDYNDFLGISALVWQESSELSLDSMFGTHSGLKLSPTDGPQWTAAEAKRLSHFVNCHGGPADPDFYGQKGKTNFPVAHSAKWMANKLVPGTVMSAECCYGAELYDPALPTAQGQMGMCNTYLGAGCYAYFGSSNTAYGPPDANDQADLICQSFLLQVVTGASAGRACIQSRLDYVANKGGVLTPTDYKTLSQFNLMGDPSLTPVAPQPHSVVLAKTAAKKTKQADPAAAVARHSRQSRRAALVARAESTRAYRLVADGARPGGGKTSLFGKLKQLAAKFGVTAPDQFVSFAVGRMQKPSGAKTLPSERAAAGQAPTAMHVILERMKPPASAPNLRLVRGVQAVEYKEGMDAKRIESR